MKICNIVIVKSKAVRFSWKIHRLTISKPHPIYHWLWFAFGIYVEGE